MIRNLATGDGILDGEGERDVSHLEFTNWLESTIQEFELGLSFDGHAFEYLIHIEQKATSPRGPEQRGDGIGSLPVAGQSYFADTYRPVEYPRRNGPR